MATSTRRRQRTKTVKKRNPQDLTLRNLRALKKRIVRLEQLLRGLRR